MSRGNKTRTDRSGEARKERVRYIDESRQVAKTLRRVRNQVERRLARTANDDEATAENVDMVCKLVQVCSRGLEVEVKAAEAVRRRQDEERRLMDDQRLRQLLRRAATDVGYLHASEAARMLEDYLTSIGVPFGAQLADAVFPGHAEPIVVRTETLRRRVLETMDNEQEDLLDMAHDLRGQVEELRASVGGAIEESSAAATDDQEGTVH